MASDPTSVTGRRVDPQPHSGDACHRRVNAYEQERISLSRELHDEIVQRVALLSADLGVFRQRLTGSSDEIQAQVARLAAETAGIGSELHRIIHGLHPTRLQQLGLEAAIGCFCAELANARRITVDLRLRDVPRTLGADVALCLYRILQEALHNVVKHSGAGHATVSLKCVRNVLEFRVMDRGVGFDALAPHRSGTLGLVSMQERARLVHAELFVWSKPGEGTSIEVHVPVQESVIA